MLRALDLALLRVLRTRGHRPPGLERAVLAFSRSGEHGALWQALCLLGMAIDPGKSRFYRRAMVTVMLAYLANIVLKYVVGRRRPVLEGGPPLTTTVTGLAYPSAHSTTSFAAAGALSRQLPPGPLYALATLMAMSRPYAGVHYPSDILAGALFGTAVEQLRAP